MATGVLVLCLGQATRITEFLATDDKVYWAQLCLGATTTTYDAQGEIVRTRPVNVTRLEWTRVACSFLGKQSQIPPMYSAIKQDGVPLYKRARRGEVVERQPREVDIRAIEVLDFALPRIEIRVYCSKGTYLRSLAHDMGERLGCGAYLAALRREASGVFRVESALSLQSIEQAFASGQGKQLLTPADAALDVPIVVADEETVLNVTHGRRVALPGEAGCGLLIRLYSRKGQFVGLLEREPSGLWRPRKVFATLEK